ncbi:sodium-dependent transporter [Arhodomonas sp. AD133]|uniref:sodium-dependent transporter n=1 Tax=Arhodomonas sp. AD133 TaxID=3415009 RepID=UPI003EBBA04E
MVTNVSQTAAVESSAAQGRERWGSRLAFVLAAAGSAVGLGNIWKFPYITGEYGGGAFVVTYLACIALIGVPILMAEVMIGRRGGNGPVGSLMRLAITERRSPLWAIAGWSGMLGSFIILSFYSVIAGWAVSYVVAAASGSFAGADADAIGAVFSGLLASPGTLIGWHTLFMAMTVAVVARGVRAGLERAVTVLMPALFVLLLVLVGYAMTTDEFSHGVTFLFAADFSQLSTEAVLAALGHAFFTLSLGMGIMIAYGSHLRRDTSIAGTAVTIAVMDTVVALLAGLAIFPVVFANGLTPGAGPGLIFQTLPLAFGNMPGGLVFGTLFFVLLTVAAWTSTISLLEPTVEWLEEQHGIRRFTAAIGAGTAIWALGLVSALSFNLWSEISLFGKGLFDLLDFLTANIMLPLTGLLVALFAGWGLSRRASADELGDGTLHAAWHFVIRFVTPAAVLIVFVYNLL